MLTRASSKRKNQPISEAQSLKTSENFAELPTELLEIIFGYVTHPVALLRLSETCKRFLAVIRSQSAPNYTLRIENMEEKRIVASIFRRASVNPVPFTKLRFHVQNDEIPTGNPIFTPFRMNVVEISVEITKSRLETVIAHIGRRFPNVRKLSVTINQNSYNPIVPQGRGSLFDLDELEVFFPASFGPLQLEFLLKTCRGLLKRFRLVINLGLLTNTLANIASITVCYFIFHPTNFSSYWSYWTSTAEKAELVIRHGSIDFQNSGLVGYIPAEVSLIQLLEINPYLTVDEFESLFSARRNIETLKFSFTDHGKSLFDEYYPEYEDVLTIEKIRTILSSGSTIRAIEFPDQINFSGKQRLMELLASIPGLEWIDFGDKRCILYGFRPSDELVHKIRSIKWFHSWYDVQRDMTLVKDTLWRMENLQKLTLGTKKGRVGFKACINDSSFQLIIQKLHKLKHLDICKSQLTDNGITGEGRPDWEPISVLVDLEYLHIGRTKDNAITNKSFNEAIRFPNLKTFIFRGKITNEGIKMLVANNKCIESLAIHYSKKVDGKALDYVVEHLPYLRELEFVLCGVRREKGEEFRRKNPFSRLKLTIYG